MLNRVALIALQTIVSRQIVYIFQSWSQTLLPAVITSTLYFSIFGRVLGDRFGLVNGFSYIQYIAPGLIMMVIINSAYSRVSGSYFINKFQRVIDELLIAPISAHIILWGYVVGGLVHSLMVGMLVTAVASGFTQIAIVHILFMLLVFFLSKI
jgi:ABC-2 type transport system permease protein